ncbi:acyltransferase [Exiguobacterium sp. s70]|uniref:acyltransferase family protein n=1 Tax=Exiguobacterium sp. s70 TaxID=2751228 RepID=UPI001BE86217|nr:acyltransferase [Exiguobacterium sp. s70]
MNSEDRLLELDALRGLAALAVVIFHYTTRYNELYGYENKLSFELAYGHYGVQLFFIISGFVIFMTVQYIPTLKDFILKRAFRLYPAYVIAVVITFLIIKIFGLPGREVSNIEALANLTMFQGFIGIPHVDGAYWSLQIELTFYLLVGFVIFLGLSNKYLMLSYIWLTASIFTKVLSFYSDGIVVKILEHLLISNYSHLFILGIIFYAFRSSLKTDFNHYVIFLICIFYEIIFFSTVNNLFTISFVLIFVLLINNKLTFLRFKPLVYLGTISYSLYVIHQNIGYVILNFLNSNNMSNEFFLVIPLIISIFLATFITYFIEKPLLKFLNNKYFKRSLKNASKGKMIV